MLLIITNSKDETADFLQAKLDARRLPLLRLDTDTFPLRPSLTIRSHREEQSAFLVDGEKAIDLRDIRAVWWRRPQDYGARACDRIVSADAKDFAAKQIKDSLDNLVSMLSSSIDVLWVNHPEKNMRANAKLAQLRAAAELGLDVPDTILSNDPERLREFFERHKGKVVFKANRRPAFYDGEDMIGFFTRRIERDHLKDDPSLQIAPVYLQEELPKHYELRVTIIGNRVFSARIDSQRYPEGVVDWRLIPIRLGLWTPYYLPVWLEERLKKLIHRFELNFAAIDLAVTADEQVVFFEINANGQWAWLEVDANLPLSDAFIDLFYDH